MKYLKALMERGGTLRRGESGFATLGLQLILRDGLGYAIQVDGDFGAKTERAVETAQAMIENRLGNTALPMRSGIVDYAFWNNLLNLMDDSAE